MKVKRQGKIAEIIRRYEIETQEELVRKLQEQGFSVTQATISRDIREMHLSKVSTGNGKICYVLPESQTEGSAEKYGRILKEGFVSCNSAGNLVVIRTSPGIAMAVATAIDDLSWDEVMGCIAGDDTIFCAVHNEEEARQVKERISKIAGLQ